MKRILGIILAILSCVALFAFLVWYGVVNGLTFGSAISSVLLAIAIVLATVGWTFFILWLLH